MSDTFWLTLAAISSWILVLLPTNSMLTAGALFVALASTALLLAAARSDDDDPAPDRYDGLLMCPGCGAPVARGMGACARCERPVPGEVDRG